VRSGFYEAISVVRISLRCLRVNGDGGRLVIALVVSLVVASVVGWNTVSSDICRFEGGTTPWRASLPLATLIAFGGFGR
jgi:hypothetical protein